MYDEETRARNAAAYRSRALSARPPEDETRAEKSIRANRRAMKEHRRYWKDHEDGDAELTATLRQLDEAEATTA